MVTVSGLLVRPGVKRKAEVSLSGDGRVLVITATSSGKATLVELANVEAVFVLPGGIHLHLLQPVQMWGTGKGVRGVQLAVSGAASVHQPGATISDSCSERSRQLGLLLDGMVSSEHLTPQQVLRNVELEFAGVGPGKGFCSHGAMGGYLFQLEQTPFMVTKIADISCLVSERVKELAADSFDLVVVLRDLETTHFISSVQKKSSRKVEAWARAAEVETYWSNVNLKWKRLLKTLAEDIDTFREEGWRHILNTDMPIPAKPAVSLQQAEPLVGVATPAPVTGGSINTSATAVAPRQVLWFGMTEEQILNGEGDEEDEDFVLGSGEESDEDDEEEEEEEEEEAEEEAEEGSDWASCNRHTLESKATPKSSPAVAPSQVLWFGMTAEQILNGEGDEEDEDYVPPPDAPTDSDDDDCKEEDIAEDGDGVEAVSSCLAEQLESKLVIEGRDGQLQREAGGGSLRWFGMPEAEIMAGNSDDDVDFVYQSEEDEYPSDDDADEEEEDEY